MEPDAHIQNKQAPSHVVLEGVEGVGFSEYTLSIADDWQSSPFPDCFPERRLMVITVSSLSTEWKQE